MPRHAAFLRGMNLGRRRIKNPELVACFEELGFTDVEAFLASGNVVFEARGSTKALTRKVEEGLAAALEYDVPTFLRSAAEVRAIVGSEPFAGSPERAGKLQVALLRGAPSTKACREVARLDSDDDRLAVVGRELYWWPNGGVSESELDFKALEKLLGPMTVRTRRTFERLAAKYF